ncbi:kell blood group glycoprotein-like [Haemaphysalis longicornis]
MGDDNDEVAVAALEDVFSRKTISLVLLASLATTVVILYVPAYARARLAACNDPRCMDLSTDLRLIMREGADPCHDFFSFVCGDFETAYAAEPTYADAVGERVKRSFRRMVRELAADFSEKVEDIPLIAYRKCMDEYHAKAEDFDPIHEYMDSLTDYWRKITGSTKLYKNVYFLLALSLKYGTPVFLRAAVVRNAFTRQQNVLQLDVEKARKPLPRAAIQKIIAHWWGRRHWEDLLHYTNVVLGTMAGIADALKDVNLDDEAPERIAVYNIGSFLSGMQPSEFTRIVREVCGDAPLNRSSIIFTTNSMALKKLAGFLNGFSPFSLLYTARFLVVESLLVTATVNVRQLFDVPKAAVLFRHRMLRCADLSLGLLSPITEYRFIRKWFGRNSSAVSDKMMTTLLEQFTEVRPYSLMGKDSKKQLSTALAATSISRGRRPGYTTYQDIQSRFSRLTFPKSTFMTWAVHALRIKADLHAAALREEHVLPVGIHDLDLRTGVIYDASEDSLRVLPAQLLPPFEVGLKPTAFDFGHLGTSVAEALAKATEPGGLSGRPAKLGLPQDDQERYLEEVDCVRRQHSERNETLGTRTALEHTSSLIGLRVAYKAWVAWEEQGTNPGTTVVKLPHVHSDEQAFFVGFCLRHCGAVSGSDGAGRPGRCNVPLRMLPEFARAFNCTANDAMTARGEQCAWVAPR